MDINQEELINFGTELNIIASKKFSASTVSYGGASFEKLLFNEFKSQFPDKVTKKQMKEWILKRLNNEFKYITAPPKWIGETEWCYLDSQPMIFVGQNTIPVTKNAKESGLALGDTFYIFAGKIIKDDGTWEQKYKIIIQDYDGNLIDSDAFIWLY